MNDTTYIILITIACTLIITLLVSYVIAMIVFDKYLKEHERMGEKDE